MRALNYGGPPALIQHPESRARAESRVLANHKLVASEQLDFGVLEVYRVADRSHHSGAGKPIVILFSLSLSLSLSLSPLALSSFYLCSPLSHSLFSSLFSLVQSAPISLSLLSQVISAPLTLSLSLFLFLSTGPRFEAASSSIHTRNSLTWQRSLAEGRGAGGHTTNKQQSSGRKFQRISECQRFGAAAAGTRHDRQSQFVNLEASVSSRQHSQRKSRFVNVSGLRFQNTQR